MVENVDEIQKMVVNFFWVNKVNLKINIVVVVVDYLNFRVGNLVNIVVGEDTEKENDFKV